ncbi:Retroelement pol Polyprotein [Phytophthora megakarya]|uniref:Retroelement pol Polyprotein n=1 Tax=Phytophthora megakarya TaxID=4795 RepID=A0A225W5F3_9STRA|nr:Retroelement pol Polyprotein [Phytophthora megakarya]
MFIWLKFLRSFGNENTSLKLAYFFGVGKGSVKNYVWHYIGSQPSKFLAIGSGKHLQGRSKAPYLDNLKTWIYNQAARSRLKDSSATEIDLRKVEQRNYIGSQPSKFLAIGSGKHLQGRSKTPYLDNLKEAFVPPDVQKRLRDQMNDLKERNCKDLPDYISKFRHLIAHVKEMSELDNIMYFLRGLSSRIREESKRNDDGPVPMYIDNVRGPSKEECMGRNLCFRCGSSTHWARNYPEHPEQKRMSRRSAPRYITWVTPSRRRGTTRVATKVKYNDRSNLFIKQGRVNGKNVQILLDTGASTNMVKPGLASTVLLSRRLQAQRFHGMLTPPTDAKHVEAPASMDGHFFPTMEFVESKRLESHDVIFGKPWFEEFNPQVNWQTKEVIIPERMQFMDVDRPTCTQQLNAGEYEQVYRVKLPIELYLDEIPGPIRKVVTEEFKDVFPQQLPNGLPPMREVNFKLMLKKGALEHRSECQRWNRMLLRNLSKTSCKRVGSKFRIRHGLRISSQFQRRTQLHARCLKGSSG